MFRLLIFNLILFIFGCSPVKKVLNNPKKFDIVAKEVIKRGYCINDTVIIDSSKIDTVYTEHYVIDTLIINKSFDLDTTSSFGSKIVIKDSFLFIKCPPSKNTIKTIKQIQYIRDTKLENILKEEITLKSDSLKQNKLILKQQDVTIKELKLESVKQKGKFIVLLTIISFCFIIYIINKFKRL